MHVQSLIPLCRCPKCGAQAIVLLTPKERLAQPDDTTHVCHPGLGGCNHGFTDDRTRGPHGFAVMSVAAGPIFTRRTKVAMIRAPGFPVGVEAPLSLNCPCEAAPRTVLNGPAVTCACGVRYSANGWVLA